MTAADKARKRRRTIHLIVRRLLSPQADMSKWFLVLPVFLLGAAAAHAQPPPIVIEQATNDPSALTILAEIALERGDCKVASENYLEALPAGNANLAKRAASVALACEHLPAAWQAAQRLRRLSPEDPDAASIYASVALRLYKVTEAQDAIRTVLKGSGSEPRLAELTALLLDGSEAPAVLKAIAGAVNEASASPAVLTLLSELALNAYNFSQAEHYAHAALAKDPRLFEAQSLLSQVYSRQGEADKALAAAQAAMDADAKRGIFEKSQALINLNRIDDARKELDRIRSGNDAISAEIDRKLALLALQENNREEARRLFTSLGETPEGADTAVFYLAEIDALSGDDDKALAGYRRLFNSQVAMTARTRAAGILLDRGNRGEALKLLDDYLAEHPESAFELTITKAHLLADHGEADSGLALVTAALEQHPEHPSLLYDRAVMLEAGGKVREAVGVLQGLSDKRPEDPNILNALGYTLADHGMRLPHAESLIRRALAQTPDNPAVIDSEGWVRFKRGDARGAEKILARAYALSRDSEIAAHWGEAAWKSGEKTQARKIWSDALALDPDSKALQAVIGRFVPLKKPEA
jgi:tetratricopeptide (TPR) repeat protein